MKLVEHKGRFKNKILVFCVTICSFTYTFESIGNWQPMLSARYNLYSNNLKQ